MGLGGQRCGWGQLGWLWKEGTVLGLRGQQGQFWVRGATNRSRPRSVHPFTPHPRQQQRWVQDPHKAQSLGGLRALGARLSPAAPGLSPGSILLRGHPGGAVQPGGAQGLWLGDSSWICWAEAVSGSSTSTL